MSASSPLWSIVLAAGDGSRLASLTRDAAGRVVPKQYWRFGGPDTMLRWTLERIAPLVPAERVVPVVAEAHRRWWSTELREHRHTVVQPSNRGTAPGLLLPLFRIAMLDPDATVLVTPSDHFVEDPAPLRRTIRTAQAAVDDDPDTVLVLGVVPDSPDSEYGWILPTSQVSRRGVRRLAAFVEKPPRETALELFGLGGVWNSFMLVGRVRAFLGMIRDTQAELFARFLEGIADGIYDSAAPLAELYGEIPNVDFSRDVLESASGRLGLLAVPPCGWTDLGTLARVEEWERSRRPVPAVTDARAAGPRRSDRVGAFAGRVPSAPLPVSV